MAQNVTPEQHIEVGDGFKFDACHVECDSVRQNTAGWTVADREQKHDLELIGIDHFPAMHAANGLLANWPKPNIADNFW